jgi:hypothetical protein
MDEIISLLLGEFREKGIPPWSSGRLVFMMSQEKFVWPWA